jgi:cysteine dioxygenase
MSTATASLREMLSRLDAYDDRIPLDVLENHLRELDIGIDDIRAFVHFGDKGYQRNLMHTGPAYQALVLCWRSGQRSPIHDHKGSSCGVRVVSGVATETLFEMTDGGHVLATESRHMAAGSVLGSQDMDLHQVSNLQPAGSDLVTIHIYSPPLLRMGVYSLTDGRREELHDPISEVALRRP